MTTATDARLQWGATALMPTPDTLDLPYRIEVSADGTNWGNPDAVITAVQSRLQDGSLAIVDSFGNRDAPIYLRVLARTYDDLSAGEAALVGESRVEGYNTLTWTPSEAFAVPTVFDVVYGILQFDFDDLGEVELTRRFVATLNCLPFPRSATEVVARAIGTGAPVVPVTETISDGSSTTGWTGYNNDRNENPGSAITVDTLDGYVRVRGAVSGGARDLITAGLAQNVDLSTTRYVAIDYRSGNAGAVWIDNVASATRTPGGPFNDVMLFKHIVTGPAPRSGFTRSIFLAPEGTGTVSVLRVQWLCSASYLPHVHVDQILRSNVVLGVSNARQLARNLTVAGTVRTQGRLAIEHETDALGDVLCYVYRATQSDTYVPSLRPYLTAGEMSETNTHTISGVQNSFDTDATFSIPAAALVAGNHRLMMSLLCDDTSVAGFNTPVTVVVDTLVGDVAIPGSQTYAETVWVNPGLEPTIVDICGLTLPATQLANTAGAVVRIRAHASDVDAAGSYHGVFFDEGWLFNIDIGTLSHVRCGIGTAAPGGPSRRLWFDPANVTNDGQDAVFRGHSADRSDAFSPADGIEGLTFPVFEGGEVTVFTVTSKAENAAVSLAYYPRFLHNAFKVPVDENGELISDSDGVAV